MNLVDLPPFRYFMIPDYKENESACVLMGHHSLCDGVQIFSILQAMTTTKDFSKLPRVSPPTWMQTAAAVILSPLATLWTAY